MTFYGIEKKGGEVSEVLRWTSSTARPPGAAVQWATGETWNGDNFSTLTGRELYMAPRGWRRPQSRVSLAELARSIEDACREEAG